MVLIGKKIHGVLIYVAMAVWEVQLLSDLLGLIFVDKRHTTKSMKIYRP